MISRYTILSDGVLFDPKIYRENKKINKDINENISIKKNINKDNNKDIVKYIDNEKFSEMNQYFILYC